MPRTALTKISFRLDPGLACERGEGLGLRLDVRRELLRRSARSRLDAALEVALPELRLVHRPRDFRVQLRQDFARRAGGSDVAVPGHVFESREPGFVERRQ